MRGDRERREQTTHATPPVVSRKSSVVRSSSRLTSHDSSTERRAEPARAFRVRLEAGDYRGLFDPALNDLMVQAAAERGVGDELAILRIVMARLLAEEDDPVTLAKAIARVATVSIQAARAQRAINGQLAEGLTDALTAILAEMETGGGTR